MPARVQSLSRNNAPLEGRKIWTVRTIRLPIDFRPLQFKTSDGYDGVELNIELSFDIRFHQH